MGRTVDWVLDIHPLLWDLSWFEKDTEQFSTLDCGCRVRPPLSVSGFWILGYWGDMSEIFGQTWLSMMHPMTLPGDICRDPRVERLLGKYRRRNSPTEAYCFCLVSTTYLLKIRPWPTIIRTVLLNFFFVTRKAYPSPRRGKDSHAPLIGLISHITMDIKFPLSAHLLVFRGGGKQAMNENNTSCHCNFLSRVYLMSVDDCDFRMTTEWLGVYVQR